MPWTIVDHRAGVRPTTPDLRPIIGRYLHQAPVYVFNGLGSRGLALGPWLADALAAHILDGHTLPIEVSPSRFAPVPTGASRWHAVDIARAEALLRVRPGDHVVDLTVGNGGDTLWLAEAVGSQGRVSGFDVQPAARRPSLGPSPSNLYTQGLAVGGAGLSTPAPSARLPPRDLGGYKRKARGRLAARLETDC